MYTYVYICREPSRNLEHIYIYTHKYTYKHFVCVCTSYTDHNHQKSLHINMPLLCACTIVRYSGLSVASWMCMNAHTHAQVMHKQRTTEASVRISNYMHGQTN